MPNYRQVRMSYFVFIGMPLLGGLVWLMTQSNNADRGLVILDVPADVTVIIDDRPLKPCLHEFKAPASCKVEPQPGFSRRYEYEALRDRTIEIEATRGASRAKIKTHVDAVAPAPHYRLDGDTFAWVKLGGVRYQDGKPFFVDPDGNVVGPVGESEPD